MLRTLRTSLEHGVYLSSVAYNTRAQLAIFMRTLSSAPDQEAPRSLKEMCKQQLHAARESKTLKEEVVLTTPQGSIVGVQDGAFEEKELINLCSNNYLGLCNHPSINEAAIQAIKSHGHGLSSVRFICGTTDLHKELEETITKFHGTEDTILYPSGFDSNTAFFESILTGEDAVISDELNHASIIDGIRLSKALRLKFKHMDMGDLERQLHEADKQGARVKVIATDGVFSMDGHIAPLKEIVGLARKYNAYTFVDDCHATGVIGHTGRGTEECWGLQGQVDFISSTLGKALGGATGGYTTGKREVVQLLRQRARPYLFSNTLAPSATSGALKAFDLVSSLPDLLNNLHTNTSFFRNAMSQAGFATGTGWHPIVPIHLGNAATAKEMASLLLQRGIFVVAFSYPVVPKDKARIRVQISAAHTRKQLERAVDAFQETREKMEEKAAIRFPNTLDPRSIEV